jgi:glycosyltransferase involved in cell wall biosynthesis
MSSFSKISIVTPSFNQGAFIEEALQSVKDQSHPSLEHIVIDGSSTDTTIPILEKYSKQPGWQHLQWVSEPDQGQSDALNKGFRMATGDIVGWLNSDDRYHPHCFEKIVSAFQVSPDTDIVYGDYNDMDEAGSISRIRREIEFSRFVLSYHRVLYIPTTSTFFRRRIFEEGNWIDTRYHYAMDYEFFLRLAHAGYRFRHIPHLLADFRWHSESKSGSQSKKQLAEHDEIARMYSSILRRTPRGVPLAVARKGVRLLAGARRYSEKLLRGYYFERLRMAPFDRESPTKP